MGGSVLSLFDSESALMEVVPESMRPGLQFFPAFTHVLTHKDLHLHVTRLPVSDVAWQCPQSVWVDSAKWPALGLPAPVRKLLSGVF
jgi:A/G-specific adenine glycosylase